MSGVHFHLVFTHAAVATIIIGLLVLLWSLLRRSHDVRMTALGLIMLGALLMIPVYITGEDAEHVIEEQTTISHDIVHEHEESAELTFIAVEVLGAAALFALLVGARRKSVGTGIATGVLALGIVVSVLMVQTANLGGEIRHSEIRSSVSSGTTEGEQDYEHDESSQYRESE